LGSEGIGLNGRAAGKTKPAIFGKIARTLAAFRRLHPTNVSSKHMPAAWEPLLAKWQEAGLIDPEAAARIREFEQRETGSSRLRWPAVAAISFGGIMLIAGVLLFVSAHWEEIAPSTRFTMVVSMVAIFHAAGAYAAPRMEALAIALHGIGTATLGAGIYLSGQIFNMSEHWPAAILMWAAGAWVGWYLRRDWVQFAFAALLTPAWIGSEWVDAHPTNNQFAEQMLTQGLLLLAITYFTAPRSKVLVWIGGIGLLPCILAILFERHSAELKGSDAALGYAMAYGLPLVVAFLLRRKLAWMNGVAAIWVFLFVTIARADASSPLLYFWCGLGAAGLVAWGMFEHRGARINLGMAGFAITVLAFYFSNVMDKLGRSASLIGLGVLFLAGGWALEKLRRKLVAQMRQPA
jgi:uncharacterized membrane protein